MEIINILAEGENMKIAILVRKETMDKCIGKGCFKAFFGRKDSFKDYDDEVEIVGFTHHEGDLDKKIERFKNEGVDTIHVSTCLRGKYDGYEEMCRRLAKDFNVVGYTHGDRIGKNKDAIILDRLIEE